MTYRNTSDAPATAARTATFTARDAGGAGSAATRTITVAAVNDAPAITTSAGPLGYTESDPATTIDRGLMLADPDSPITGATVQITGNPSPGDVLALAPLPFITQSYDAGTGTLTLSGSASAAAYQAALRAVTYRNTSSNPSTAQRTVTFLASDGDGHVGAGHASDQRERHRQRARRRHLGRRARLHRERSGHGDRHDDHHHRRRLREPDRRDGAAHRRLRRGRGRARAAGAAGRDRRLRRRHRAR